MPRRRTAPRRRWRRARSAWPTWRSRRVKRHPPAPFTTSTLQQEASRKLGMGAQATMRCAQQLYEGIELDGETTGLITYMRTDGVQMAREAMFAIREHVQERLRPALRARSAARVLVQGQERPGGARGRSDRRTCPGCRTAWPGSSAPSRRGCTNWCGSAPSHRRCNRPSWTRSRWTWTAGGRGCAPTAPSSRSTGS